MDPRTQELFDKATQLRADVRALVEQLRDRQCEIFETLAKREDSRARLLEQWRVDQWPMTSASTNT